MCNSTGRGGRPFLTWLVKKKGAEIALRAQMFASCF